MSFNKICVLGGSGFVGTALVSELVARGKHVKVLTRRREHAKGLILLPTVEVVEADIHDQRVLARELRGCDAAINLVGILHETRKGRVDKPQARRGDFQKNHVELPRKAINACAEVGISRFLHMSALGADPTSRSTYQRSKGVGEALVREAGLQAADNPGTLGGAKLTARRAMAVTIFRPSVIFGPGDSFLNLFARLLRLLPVIPLACPQARFQPVYLGDVAKAFADSLDDLDTYGRTYDLCGPDEYTLFELMQFLQQVLKGGGRLIPLSDRLSYLNAWMLEFKPGAKLMTRDNYYAMQTPNVCTGGNSQPPGWQPQSLVALAPAWLGGAEARSHYGEYRNQAHR